MAKPKLDLPQNPVLQCINPLIGRSDNNNVCTHAVIISMVRGFSVFEHDTVVLASLNEKTIETKFYHTKMDDACAALGCASDYARDCRNINIARSCVILIQNNEDQYKPCYVALEKPMHETLKNIIARATAIVTRPASASASASV
jgi:hypothetical protein